MTRTSSRFRRSGPLRSKALSASESEGLELEKLLIPVYLPKWVKESLLKVKRALFPLPAIDLAGDREIEWRMWRRGCPWALAPFSISALVMEL